MLQEAKIIGTKDYTVPMFGNKQSEPYGKLVVSLDGAEIAVPIRNSKEGSYIVLKGTRYPVRNAGSLYSPRYEFVGNFLTIMCSRCGCTEDLTYTPEQLDAAITKGWNSYGRALYCPECSRTWHDRNTKELAGRTHTIGVIWRLHRSLQGIVLEG